MPALTAQTIHSVCDFVACGKPITITIEPGQRWDQVAWTHAADATAGHPARPEMRFAIDATCPGCGYPEIGFAPARGEFVCSRCQHTQTERPKG